MSGGLEWCHSYQDSIGRFGGNTYVSSCDGSKGDMWVNTIMSVLDTAGTIGAALLASSGGSEGDSVAATNARVSKTAAAIVSSYSSDMAAAQGEFQTRYADFGITISKTGVPTKTYAQAKSELEVQLAKMNEKITTGNDKSNFDNYNNQLTLVNSLRSAVNQYSDLATQLSKQAAANTDKISINPSSNPPATANNPNAKDYEMYLTEEQKRSGVSGASTQAYKDALGANQTAANTYNDTFSAQQKLLTSNGVKTLDELQTKLSNEESKLTEPKNQDYVGGSKIGNLDVANFVQTRNNLLSQQAKLGTEAEFNAAVNKVRGVYQAYTNAQAVIENENRARESDNLVANSRSALMNAKRGNHTGLRGWLYDIFHKDRNDNDVVAARLNYNNARENSTAAHQGLQNTYERFYPTS